MINYCRCVLLLLAIFVSDRAICKQNLSFAQLRTEPYCSDTVVTNAKNCNSAYYTMEVDDYIRQREQELKQLSDSLNNSGQENKKLNIFQKFYRYFDNSNKKSNKKFDISVIGGPNYSSDTKLGIGLVAAGLYSTNRSDTLTPYSNISLYGDVATSGFYMLGIKGNNIFTRENWRIDYSVFFTSFPSYLWGLGYDHANLDDNKTKYLSRMCIVKSDVLFRVAPNFYIGPALGFSFTKGTKFDDRNVIEGRPATFRSIDYGAILSYDSRDVMTNAYKGILLNFTQKVSNYFNQKPFFKTDLEFNSYNKVWKGCILATNTFASFNYGKVPWSLMAKIGGSSRMRGYYEGRYRDDNMVTTQVELRQKIYNRHGVVVWGGAGNVWGSECSFSWSHTLPNAGIGYRWELKKRMNIRLDYGIGKNGQHSFMFGINEAF